METMQFHFKQVHKITKPQAQMNIGCMRYSNIPSDAKTILAKEAEVEIRLIHDSPNETACFYLYLARKDDDICRAGWGDATSGCQQTGRGFYVDRIALIQGWLSPVYVVGNTPNGMSRILIKTHGYHRLFVLIDGRGTWYVDMAGMC